MLPSPSPRPDRNGLSTGEGREQVALVFGGGNALGAYLAGAYERLTEIRAELDPDGVFRAKHAID